MTLLKIKILDILEFSIYRKKFQKNNFKNLFYCYFIIFQNISFAEKFICIWDYFTNNF